LRTLGRYVIHESLASGGMATVHLGTLRVPERAFSRVVAIKILHAHVAADARLRRMFLEEARLVSRIRHANVASTIDVIGDGDELVVVMDYVDGAPVSALLKALWTKGEPFPLPVAIGIAIDMLEGLHAAHETTSDTGAPLGVVHRDVSPQNVLVGFDGVARLVDFGVAKSLAQAHETAPGEVKGKAGYMAPEQARGQGVDRRADVYGASVVLWEMLTGTRMVRGETFAEALLNQLTVKPEAPSRLRSNVSKELDAIVLRGLAPKPEDRFPTARAMAEALTELRLRASAAEIGAFVRTTCEELFVARRALLQRVASAQDTPRKPRRAWRWLLAAAAALALMGSAALVSARRARAPSAPEPLPASSTAAVVVAPPPPEVPAPDPTPPAPPAPRQTTKPAARPRPPAPSASAPAPKNCCAPDGLRIRFADCVDNCKP
jgi:serine/threonine-protein kinase